jgi:hypothetical protein
MIPDQLTIAQWKAYAANDTSPPKCFCLDEIEVKGEPLDPVIW